MQKGIARIERTMAEIEDFDVSVLTKRWSAPQTALEQTIDGALSSVFGHGTVEYNRYAGAAKLDNAGVFVSLDGPRDTGPEARRNVTEGKAAALLTLGSAVKWMKDELADRTEVTADPSVSSSPNIPNQKVFIVHGHDDAARLGVARFIEQLGFEAVVLSEQANQGRTIIEKIEANRDVGFAVVLLTPDDVGGKTAEALSPRARQNVLLELGYFMAHLGRHRICSLTKGDVELPTDFAGVVWEAMDNAGSWKQSLAREMKAAGYEIDWNKVMK